MGFFFFEKVELLVLYAKRKETESKQSHNYVIQYTERAPRCTDKKSYYRNVKQSEPEEKISHLLFAPLAYFKVDHKDM